MASEKRLIDANWILGEIEHDLGCYDIGKLAEDDVLYVDIRDIVKMVCAAPTVDAVEVVRCKDCKHYDNSEGIFWCHLNSKFYPGGFDWHSFPEDGFCCYGERKDNGD